MANNEYYFKKVSEMTGYELIDLIVKAINKSNVTNISLNKELPPAIGELIKSKIIKDGGSEIKC